MSLINELNDLVNSKFEEPKPKQEEVYQEFVVLVKVTADNVNAIREKLDEAVQNLKSVKEVVDVSQG